MLTPQKCFPVNADGIGTCPEEPCCKELRDKIGTGVVVADDCGLSSLPSVSFAAGKATLTNNNMSVLARVASQIKNAPNCRIRVVGRGTSDKRTQQLSWQRVKNIINYFVARQGIGQDRFIFSYGEEGSPNTVDLISTRESGPNTVPAPHPNLRK